MADQVYGYESRQSKSVDRGVGQHKEDRASGRSLTDETAAQFGAQRTRVSDRVAQNKPNLVS
jgi:hypothetical protein